MKILVAIACVPDTTSKIDFKDSLHFNKENVQYILNPYDEWYALSKALEFKEKHNAQVTVITVDTAFADANIRKALAIGADEAVRIDAEPEDGAFVAQQIAYFIKDHPFDLIMVGKESISDNNGQIGALIAAHLQIGYIAEVMDLQYEKDTFVGKVEVQSGMIHTYSAAAPLLISATKGLAEQRIPNMRGIMSAKTKPLQVLPVTQKAAAKVQTLSYRLPATRSGCKMFDTKDVDLLVKELKETEKVI